MPLTDRVIIEPFAAPEKVGAIFMPQMGNDKPTRGRVVAVGPGRVSEQGTLIPMTVKVGDEVIFDVYVAAQMKVDGADVCMVHEPDINCIIRK